MEMTIDDYEAYFGWMSRTFVERSLKKTGDFLVRFGKADNGAPVLLIAAFIGARGIKYKTIAFNMQNSSWHLEDEKKPNDGFDSIVLLLNYYKTNSLPGLSNSIERGARLLNPVRRPFWMLNRNLLRKNDAPPLGEGNFCVVHIGSYMEFPVAIKVCHMQVPMGETKAAIEGDDSKDSSKRANIELALSGADQEQFALLEEAEVMANLTHPNIILFVGLCCESPPLQLVMEFCGGGSLLSHLEKMHEKSLKISDNEMVLYMQQISDGMTYLQSQDMIHRDLACRNVLLNKYGDLKISDFGLAKLAAAMYGENISHNQIPLRGMAPECLVANAKFSVKSDVWSYGMLVYELYNHGNQPPEWNNWPLKKIATYIRRIKMPPPPKNMPKEVSDLVSKCWKKEPENRPGFPELSADIKTISKSYPPPNPKETTLCEHAKLTPATPVDAEEQRKQQTIAEQIRDAICLRREAFARMRKGKMPVNKNTMTCEEKDDKVSPKSPVPNLEGAPTELKQDVKEKRSNKDEHRNDEKKRVRKKEKHSRDRSKDASSSSQGETEEKHKKRKKSKSARTRNKPRSGKASVNESGSSEEEDSSESYERKKRRHRHQDKRKSRSHAKHSRRKRSSGSR